MTRKATFTCAACLKGFRVHGNKELLKKCVEVEARCPHCDTQLEVGYSSKSREHIELDVGDFWRAVHGFGLPDEVVAGHEAIEALLLTHRVAAVDANKTRTGRVEIRSLTLANGVKLHFASSGEGAVIFKATKEMLDGSKS